MGAHFRNAGFRQGPCCVQVSVLHILAYYLGYRMARATVARDNVPLARCISLESGMQSSLLGLLLASRFFRDPLVSLPCGISTVVMTLVSHSRLVPMVRQSTARQCVWCKNFPTILEPDTRLCETRW